MNIKDFTEKQEFKSPLTGKPILIITRISDGTAKTVPTVHRFAKVDQNGQYLRDEDGKLIFKLEQHEYPIGKDKARRDIGWKIYKKDDRDHADLEWDKKDKRIWWVENPVMRNEVFGKTKKTFVAKGDHKVGTYEEFLARVEEIEEQIVAEKNDARVKEKQDNLEVAITAGSVIAEKIVEGKKADAYEGNGRAWSEEDDKWLADNFVKKSFKQLSTKFGVPIKAVKEHCVEIGLEEE